MLNQPVVAKPGYFRKLRVTHTLVTAGTITGSTGLAADAPENVVSFLKVADAFGTPLISGDGYSTAKLINLYGGAFGVNNGTNNIESLPSYTAPSYTTGAGTYSYAIPFEFAMALGCIGAANASLPPSVFFQFNSGANVFTGGTALFPSITTQMDADFYWLPDVNIEPPGLGTTRQWQLTPINPSVAASSSGRVQVARLGGYLDTLIFIVRDSTNARSDGFWPTGRFQVLTDGVAFLDTTMSELYDDMWIQFGAVARPAGVVAISRKTSLSQQSLGLLDSGEVTLSTSPGTLMELNASPWGAGSNSPATLQALLGQIVPTQAMIYGEPEL